MKHIVKGGQFLPFKTEDTDKFPSGIAGQFAFIPNEGVLKGMRVVASLDKPLNRDETYPVFETLMLKVSPTLDQEPILDAMPVERWSAALEELMTQVTRGDLIRGVDGANWQLPLLEPAASGAASGADDPFGDMDDWLSNQLNDLNQLLNDPNTSEGMAKGMTQLLGIMTKAVENVTRPAQSEGLETILLVADIPLPNGSSVKVFKVDVSPDRYALRETGNLDFTYYDMSADTAFRMIAKLITGDTQDGAQDGGDS